jgi:hypothetical protein
LVDEFKARGSVERAEGRLRAALLRSAALLNDKVSEVAVTRLSAFGRQQPVLNRRSASGRMRELLADSEPLRRGSQRRLPRAKRGRAEAARIRALAREGIDWPAQEEARVTKAFAEAESAQRLEGLTLAQAVREYVHNKRRAKDGLPLKARTRADYLAMIEPGRVSSDGRKFADGELHPLAHKVLTAITGNDIRALHAVVLKRSERQAAYAMQVLRAVMRWHGVILADNPLARDTAGRDRIIIATGAGEPAPIPPERLGAWWRAAAAAPSRVAADYYRFQLLTGCRGIEIHGNKKHRYPAIRIGDLDAQGGKIVLRDTKNRSDHKLLLSRQALEIARTTRRSASLKSRCFLLSMHARPWPGSIRRRVRRCGAMASGPRSPALPKNWCRARC